MRKSLRFSTLSVVIFAAAGCLAQNKPTVDCTKPIPDSACSVMWQNGVKFIVIEDRFVKIVAEANYEWLDRKTAFRTMGVSNLSDNIIDIDPSRFVAALPGGVSVSASNGDALLDTRRKHDNFWNSLTAVVDAAGTGNQPAAVSTSSGNTTTTVATNAATARQADRQGAIDNQFSAQSSQVLRHFTLSKSQYAAGNVYFEKPKGTDKHAGFEGITLTIGDRSYVL